MPFVTTLSRLIGCLLPLLAAILCWRVPPALAYQTATPAEAQAATRPMINEIMAANVSTIVDPDFGAFADWIEIFNPGEEAVDLGGYTLTDDIRNPVKWSVSSGSLVPAGGYLLFWPDGRDSGRHSNFRLSRDGEEVALYDSDGLLVDMVRFGDQVENVSYGRIADGAAEWAFFQQPTPGRMNEGASVPSMTQAPAPEFSEAGGRYRGCPKLAIPGDGTTLHAGRFETNGRFGPLSGAHPPCRNGRGQGAGLRQRPAGQPHTHTDLRGWRANAAASRLAGD